MTGDALASVPEAVRPPQEPKGRAGSPTRPSGPDVRSRYPFALELEPEPDLRLPELRRRMLQVLGRRAFGSADAPVRPVEHVEHLGDEIDREALQRDPLLHAHVGLVVRRPDDVVARNDRPVRTQARAAATDHAQVAAPRARAADAGAEVVKAAHLEALADLPDAVEHRAVPL